VTVQFAVERGGQAVAGLAVVAHEADRVRLVALGPVGVELFRVEAAPDRLDVQAPGAWGPTLERLPWYRDLSLIHVWRCPEGRCTAPGGSIRERPQDGAVVRRWRGAGGPVTVEITPGSALLRDRRRGYTLRLVGEGIGDR